MAIKVTCPRCKTALQVPPKLLGQYTQCPACQNRILIPPVPPMASSSGAAGDVQPGVAPTSSAQAAVESNVQVAVANPMQAVPAAVAQTSVAPGQPAPPPGVRSTVSMPAAAWSGHATPEPVPVRKVARFITAESAPSTVQLAPGGELPTLQLAEGAQANKSGPKTSTMNPLVLVGAACFSFCMCVLLLLADFDTTGVDSQRETGIRQKLESYYKNPDGPLQPYQVHLREAQQARSRGDRQAEQQHYRKVLNLLHAERDPRDRFRGLTGTPQSDQDLEKLLARLLAGSQADGSEESN